MANQWFRMYAEFATDPKVQSMSEAMQRRLVMLFCLRSCDVLVTLRERDIAFALRVTEQELSETKREFVEAGFINEQWTLLNWTKRQYVSDSSTSRTRLYRERIKTSQVTVCDKPERHSDALDTDTDTDTEEIQKRSKNTTVHSQDEFSVWADAVCDRHPNPADRMQNKFKLVQEFAGKERSQFEANHKAWCKSERWKERGGAFVPRLWKWIEDGAWKRPVPKEIPRNESVTQRMLREAEEAEEMGNGSH